MVIPDKAKKSEKKLARKNYCLVDPQVHNNVGSSPKGVGEFLFSEGLPACIAGFPALILFDFPIFLALQPWTWLTVRPSLRGPLL